MKRSRIAGPFRAVAGLLLGLGLVACATTKTVDSWHTDQPVTHKPDKVAVIVALPDALMRKAIEIDMANEMVKKGVPAVAASNLPGLGGGIRGKIDTEKVGQILEKDGADGVIVSFYTGGGRSGDYVRSGYYAEYEGTGIGYGWAQPYFVDVYTIQHGEDIDDFTISAYVETTYYDLETEHSVWRIVTETKDIEHADTAVAIAHKAASQMASSGLK